MANFKTVVRNQRKDGFWPVYIRVTHHRVHGYVKTDKVVTSQQLSPTREVLDPYVISYCAQLMIEFNDRLNRKDISTWTTVQVVDFLNHRDDDICFSDYARKHVTRMIARGQTRNARNYEMAYQHLERYAGTNKVKFSQLTSTFVNGWIQSLEQTKRAKEMYPVCMRQVFKEAVDELNDYDNGIIRIKTNPWAKVKIPKADTPEQKAISVEACRAFFRFELPESKMREPLTVFSRDVAMLVLCLAGMNTVDLYSLKKEDYQDGVIRYHRAKTMRARSDKAYFEIAVEPIIEPIIKKYLAPKSDPYLFNFHKRFATSDSFNGNANGGIKQICKLMEIPANESYSIYTWRHTWATIAQNDCDASIEDVAFALNHSHGHRVTRGYIRLDFTPVWKLNRKVLAFIFESEEPGKQGAARDIEEPQGKLFRITPKMMIYGRAYFRGEVLAEVSDIGFSTVDEVIQRLAKGLPATIPNQCTVQFRIQNLDTDREAVYPRTKGKGF